MAWGNVTRSCHFCADKSARYVFLHFTVHALSLLQFSYFQQATWCWNTLWMVTFMDASNARYFSLESVNFCNKQKLTICIQQSHCVRLENWCFVDKDPGLHWIRVHLCTLENLQNWIKLFSLVNTKYAINFSFQIINKTVSTNH